jgi:hypothetical protein
MAHVNAALVQKVFNITERKWKSNIKHHRKANDLWAGFEIARRSAAAHPMRINHHRPTLVNFLYLRR